MVDAAATLSYARLTSGVRIRPKTGARETQPQDALCAGVRRVIRRGIELVVELKDLFSGPLIRCSCVR